MGFSVFSRLFNPTYAEIMWRANTFSKINNKDEGDYIFSLEVKLWQLKLIL